MYRGDCAATIRYVHDEVSLSHFFRANPYNYLLYWSAGCCRVSRAPTDQHPHFDRSTGHVGPRICSDYLERAPERALRSATATGEAVLLACRHTIVPGCAFNPCCHRLVGSGVARHSRWDTTALSSSPSRGIQTRWRTNSSCVSAVAHILRAWQYGRGDRVARVRLAAPASHIQCANGQLAYRCRLGRVASSALLDEWGNTIAYPNGLVSALCSGRGNSVHLALQQHQWQSANRNTLSCRDPSD